MQQQQPRARHKNNIARPGPNKPKFRARLQLLSSAALCVAWLFFVFGLQAYLFHEVQHLQHLERIPAPDRLDSVPGKDDADTPSEVELNDADDSPDHHIAFSSGCSKQQDWQSLAFFHSAHRVGQPGTVTRIVSGCRPKERKRTMELHERTVARLSPDYKLHFTQDFSQLTKDSYKYYNKPYGLEDWFAGGLKYVQNEQKLEDDVFIVLDPDMMLLRPLTHDFSGSDVRIANVNAMREGPPKEMRVMHGQPFASFYFFGSAPFELNLTHVFENHPDSPALTVSKEDQVNRHAGGPVYMATGRDMFAIVNTWCEIVPRVHQVYDKLLGEMFAWSLASAHLRLPHYLATSFAIDNVNQGQSEGWPLIDALDQSEICDLSALAGKESKLPFVLHYSQIYWVGRWLTGKYNIPSAFWSCNHTLFKEPPKDTGPVGELRGIEELRGMKRTKIRPEHLKREQFVICQMVLRLNEVATWFKDRTCEEGTANYEKSYMGETL